MYLQDTILVFFNIYGFLGYRFNVEHLEVYKLTWSDKILDFHELQHDSFNTSTNFILSLIS